MFSQLSQTISKTINKIRSFGVISEATLNEVLREIRLALLEADVSLSVVKEFIESVKAKALKLEISKAVSASQAILKIVTEELTEILGGQSKQFELSGASCTIILMLGLQGAGKTTTAAKLAYKITKKMKKKVLLVSGDIHRPAAQDQLEILAKQLNIEYLKTPKGASVEDIANMTLLERNKNDVIIFDTAGRGDTDEHMMQELKTIYGILEPNEAVLVVDSMTGQICVKIGRAFADSVNVTGIILTRVDGDARGGAALSISKTLNIPIYFTGSGEKVGDLEDFHPNRVASRILGMGDITSLMEKAKDTIGSQEIKSLTQKLKQGKFDMQDLLDQLKNLNKMGGIASMIGMIPGFGKLKGAVPNAAKAGNASKQIAIIHSMTVEERSLPNILSSSRKVRIAKGAGVGVQEVNKLLKQFDEMSKMIKKIGKMDAKQMSRFADSFK